MRIWGMIKVLIILAVDAGLVYAASECWEAALIVTGCMLLYALLGENLALLKDRAIRMEKLAPTQRIALQNAKAALVQDVLNATGKDISNIRFHMVPDNSINAYAYGIRNISVTKATLDATDPMTLAAVLGHEVCHTLSLDALRSRLIFANIMVVMAGLSLGSMIFTAVLWLVLAIPAMFSRSGCLGIMAANGITRLMQALTTGTQRILVAVYQALMGIASRRAEFRADAFSAQQLGYGPQLAYFLERFIAPLDSGKTTLREILYATHPEPHKRIERIQQLQENNQLQLLNMM